MATSRSFQRLLGLVFVGFTVSTAGVAGDATLLRQLHSEDPAQLERALEGVTNDGVGPCTANNPIPGALEAIVRRNDLDPQLRLAAAWALKSADCFKSVSPLVLELAQSTDEEVAREAARTLIHGGKDDPDSRQVERLYLTGDGVLATEMAIALGDGCFPEISASTHLGVAEDLQRLALDTSADPWVRGEAIESLHCYSSDPKVLDLLVGLLKPGAWFFGVPGQHSPRHSTVAVLDTLALAKVPDLASRVLFFKPLVASIPEHQNRYEVEWALDRFFKQHPDPTPDPSLLLQRGSSSRAISVGTSRSWPEG